MNPSRKRLLLTISVFLMLRTVVIFLVGNKGDTTLYYNVLERYFKQGLSFYSVNEYPYPYPPLTIPLILIPYFLSTNFSWFFRFFLIGMLCFDIINIKLLYKIGAEKLALNNQELNRLLFCYVFFGSFLLLIIYSRYDLIIATTFLLMMFFYKSSGRGRAKIYLTAAGGFLIKLVPIFWLPILLILEIFGFSKEKNRLKNFLNPVFLFFIPVSVVIIVVDYISQGELINAIFVGHANRGIQVESVWATPLFLYDHFVLKTSQLNITEDYGAHHISNSFVPPFWLWGSRYLGFILIFIFCLIFIYLYKKILIQKPNFKLSFNLYFLLSFSLLLILVSTQKVLSPQFFIWVLPGFCLWLVKKNSWLFFQGIFLVYFLTFMDFPLGYPGLIRKLPSSIFFVAIRNLFLIIISTCIVRDSIKALRTEGKLPINLIKHQT